MDFKNLSKEDKKKLKKYVMLGIFAVVVVLAVVFGS